MFTVRGTKEFLDRAGSPIADPPSSSTVLGDWYANVLFWRPQVALFVNATTFVPVLMPLAPAAGAVARFPMAMVEVFGALGVDPRFVEFESTEMSSVVCVLQRVVATAMADSRRLPAVSQAQDPASCPATRPFTRPSTARCCMMFNETRRGEHRSWTS